MYTNIITSKDMHSDTGNIYTDHHEDAKTYKHRDIHGAIMR